MRGYGLVGVGGAAGALIRWGVSEVVPHDDGGFPWATLIVNVVGCAAVGFAAPRIARRADRWLLIVTGILGGFTTYSSFAVETHGLIDAGRSGTALVYVAVTVVAGLAATEVARGGWSAS